MKEQGYFSVVMVKEGDFSTFLSNLKGIIEGIEGFVRYGEIILVMDQELDARQMHVLNQLNEEGSIHIMLVTLRGNYNRLKRILAGVDLAIGDYIYEVAGGVTKKACSQMQTMYRHLVDDGLDMVFLGPVQKRMNRILNKMTGKRQEDLGFGHHPIRLVTRRAVNAVENNRHDDGLRGLMYQLCGLRYRCLSCHNRSTKDVMQSLRQGGYLLRLSPLGMACTYLLAIIYGGFAMGLSLLGYKAMNLPVFLLSISILFMLMGLLIHLIRGIDRENSSHEHYVADVIRLK